MSFSNTRTALNPSFLSAFNCRLSTSPVSLLRVTEYRPLSPIPVPPIFRTLFQVPYPATPLFATYENTGGVGPFWNSLLLLDIQMRGLHPEGVCRALRPSNVQTVLIPLDTSRCRSTSSDKNQSTSAASLRPPSRFSSPARRRKDSAETKSARARCPPHPKRRPPPARTSGSLPRSPLAA